MGSRQPGVKIMPPVQFSTARMSHPQGLRAAGSSAGPRGPVDAKGSPQWHASPDRIALLQFANQHDQQLQLGIERCRCRAQAKAGQDQAGDSAQYQV